jgi:hypothetical protein
VSVTKTEVYTILRDVCIVSNRLTGIDSKLSEMEILAQPLSLPFIIENLRYPHEIAPNVKVLAARVGTKGWGWQSWGEWKYSGGEAVSRARG